MLKLITCEIFNKENQVFNFQTGLNIILGDGSNSIGKTSLLKVIDYVYGGDYYIQSNEDVIQHLGHHDINFIMQFDNEDSFYKRNTKNKTTIWECDEKFIPQRAVKIADYREYLRSKLINDIVDIKFRDCVSLYSRIWNKPNKEVNSPLYRYSGQSTSDAISNLVMLFKKYNEVRGIVEQRDIIIKTEKAYKAAKQYEIIDTIKNQSELKLHKRRLDEINNALRKLENNINLFEQDIEYQAAIDTSNLFSQRAYILKQLSGTKRKLKRISDNINYNDSVQGVDSATFVQLKEFFPSINIDKLNSISNFHNRLGHILRTELNTAKVDAKKDIYNLEKQLSSINKAIENPQISNDKYKVALSEMAKLIQEKTYIEDLLERHQKSLDLKTQKGQNDEEYSKIMLTITKQIEKLINEQLKLLASQIESENNKAPKLDLNINNYSYYVQDNTGTGKAYTDLLLFDLSVFSLTELPVLIHDSFLFNNIGSETIGSFIKLYNGIDESKQSFISIDKLYDFDNDVQEIIKSTARCYLHNTKQLYSKDWR